MTITTTDWRVSYAGNGATTVFAFPYRFLSDAFLVVLEVAADGTETVKTLTTHYTVTGAGDDAGGSVTMLVAPAALTSLVIYRDTAVVQEVDYISGDSFPAETHEMALDKLTMIIQEKTAGVGNGLYRSLVVPIGDSDSINRILPSAASRANKVLSFDAVGNVTATVPSSTESAATLRADLLASAGSSLVGFVQTGTGTVARTVQAKLRDIRNVKDFGAVGDGTTDDTAAIQAALDIVASPGGSIYFPTGTYKITAKLTWGNGTQLLGDGQDTIIKGMSLTTPILQSKGGTTSRRYRLTMRDMKIDNTSAAAGGGIGIDLRNATDCKIENVWVTNCDLAIQFFGDAGLGCYYNTLTDVICTSCTGGLYFGTLANENRTYNFRTNVVGLPISAPSGSHNHHYSPSLEVFGTYGIRFSGDAADTLVVSPRLENTPTSGIGISIEATTFRTTIISPQYTGLSTNLSDASPSSFIFSAQDGVKIGGGTLAQKRQRVTATLDFSSIAAHTTADMAVTVSGALTSDAWFVTPPATLSSGLVCTAIPSSGQVYVRLANITASAIDPASATFTLDMWR